MNGLQSYQGRPKDFSRALESLKVVIGHVLVMSGGGTSCPLHASLFRATRPRAVLTFNYDLIADQSLLEIGMLNWRLKQYRGGADFARVPNQVGAMRRQRVSDRRMKSHIPLVKLHGSIHWEKVGRAKGYRLSGARLPEQGRALFEIVRIPDSPFIIPPIAAKVDVNEGVLREKWYRSLDYLSDASTWVIWGYSFPDTDTASQVLFRTALQRNKRYKRVFVVNPDHTVASRVENVCRKVNVYHFSSIERLLLELRAL